MAMQIQANRRTFIETMTAGAIAGPLVAVQRQALDKVAPYFRPPKEWRGKFGEYRSPLLFNDGSKVRTPKDWKSRRSEILKDWQNLLGHWPALITKPKVQVLEEKRRENFRQLNIFLSISFLYTCLTITW